MIRVLWLLLALWPGLAAAQTDIVAPGELDLTVTVEPAPAPPFTGEMILVTIHGRYTRHIARESLEQPALEGFSWVQLGYDGWYETTERGRPVKNFRRRMALYADRPGTLTIGPFVHHLTLTDRQNKWFAHDIASQPVTVEVRPAPLPADRWLPLGRLEISDQWSNAPDQLQPGEGVLRVIRLEATGIAPEMLPPMPELRSPSADIFPHPEQRFVELSPEGPVAIAFWRWTVRPSGPVSAVLEPLTLDYYDTRAREPRRAVISAQRIAYEAGSLPPDPVPLSEGQRPGGLTLGVLLAAAAGGLAMAGPGRIAGAGGLARRWRLRLALRRAARRGDLAGLRRTARALDALMATDDGRQALLGALDRAIYAPGSAPVEPGAFRRAFLQRL